MAAKVSFALKKLDKMIKVEINLSNKCDRVKIIHILNTKALLVIYHPKIISLVVNAVY